MRRTPSRHFVALLAAAALALPARAAAQACLGNPSFSINHLQLSGDVQFDKRATSFGASFTSGSESVFGGVGVGGITYDELDGTTLVLGGSLGYQVPVSTGGAQICPILTASFGNGPNDFDGLGTDVGVRNFGFGISLGGPLARGGRVTVVPAASLAFAFTQTTFAGPSISDELSDTYGIAGLALGFLISESLAIRPSISLPFGLEESDPIFGVGISLNYGGRR